MGWYSVAVQSPWGMHSGIAGIKEHYLYSSSHWLLHVFISQYLHGWIMVVVLKKQDMDMHPALLLTKSQSFFLHNVKVRDCLLKISQIVETYFFFLELSFSSSPWGGAGLLFCSPMETLDSSITHKGQRTLLQSSWLPLLCKIKQKV